MLNRLRPKHRIYHQGISIQARNKPEDAIANIYLSIPYNFVAAYNSKVIYLFYGCTLFYAHICHNPNGFYALRTFSSLLFSMIHNIDYSLANEGVVEWKEGERGGLLPLLLPLHAGRALQNSIFSVFHLYLKNDPSLKKNMLCTKLHVKERIDASQNTANTIV